MAYEHENSLKKRLLDLEFDTWEETIQCEREYRELQEIYHKGKSWDNYIIHLEKAATSTFGEERAKVLVEKAKNDFMGDDLKSFKQPKNSNGIYSENIPKPLKGIDNVSGKILYYYQHTTEFGLYEFWYDEDGFLYHFRTPESEENDEE